VAELAVAAENLVKGLLQVGPAETHVEIKRGRLDHSVNRRRHWPFPTIGRTYGFRLTATVMAPNPEAPTEELAPVLLLRRADDDKVIAVIWHYTCHATAVIPSDVISADFPGAVRRALRQRFGEIPCVFAQGFCGDISPKIAGTGPRESNSPGILAAGAGQIPLAEFFDGRAPDKPLSIQVLQLGTVFELIAVSAEVTVEWQSILDSALPAGEGRLRLYAGYLGALYGYLPTPRQIGEGGYEVTGFQHLFGLSGNFDAGKIVPAVVSCVKRAIDDL
jgi:hypothetical protein